MKDSNSIPKIGETNLTRKAADQTALPFGPPPLFPGEEERAYEELSARFRKLVKPVDIIEEVLLRDVVDLQWEILRLRRLKAGFSTFAIRRYQHLPKMLPDICVGPSGARDENLAIADCLSHQLDKLQQFDQLIASAEARRNMHLREIDRHRAGFGRSLREAVAAIEAPSVQPA